MFALGLCFYSLDKLLHRKAFVKHLFYFILGATVIMAIKSYIFITFAAAALVWVYRFFISLIGNKIARFVVRSAIFLAIFSTVIYFITIPENSLRQAFLLELSSGERLQELMTSVNERSGGSGYTLPPVNLNAWGIIESFLLSINVTLFRPYLWECNNVLMVMNFFESFGTLLLVLVVIFKSGIRKVFRYCSSYPVLFFMLVFSLLLAPVVGFTSFNFGTLVRYKIPFLPFFFSFLLIVLFDKKTSLVNTNKSW